MPIKADKTTQIGETVKVQSVKTQCDSGLCQQAASFDPDIEVSFSVNNKKSKTLIKEHSDHEDLTDSSYQQSEDSESEKNKISHLKKDQLPNQILWYFGHAWCLCLVHASNVLSQIP